MDSLINILNLPCVKALFIVDKQLDAIFRHTRTQALKFPLKTILESEKLP